MYCMKKIVQLVAVSSLIFGSATANANIISIQFTQINKSNVKQTFEDNDIKFQLQGCKRTTNKLTCNLLITNLADKDRDFRLIGSDYSRAIDTSGNEFKVSSAQLGQEKAEYPTVKIVPGIPIKASITFNSIPKEVNQLALLEIAYNFVYGNSYNVKFHDIKIINSN